MSWGKCQVPEEYLGALRGILRGSCEDFVTLGVDKSRSFVYARLDNKVSAHL